MKLGRGLLVMLVLMVALLSSGCGTAVNIVDIGDWNPVFEAPHGVPYGGCQYDAFAVAEISQQLLDSIEMFVCRPSRMDACDLLLLFLEGGITIGYVGYVDYPLCEISDTLTLPYLLLRPWPDADAYHPPEFVPDFFPPLPTELLTPPKGVPEPDPVSVPAKTK